MMVSCDRPVVVFSDGFADGFHPAICAIAVNYRAIAYLDSMRGLGYSVGRGRILSDWCRYHR